MIPKTIHCCWFSGQPPGPLQEKCLASWRKHCPEYEIKLADTSSWDASRFLFSSQALAHGQWAFVSDVFRLDVLHREGGVYLDLDVELRKSLDPLLDCQFFTGTERGNPVSVITPYIMGAVPSNDLIGKFLAHYKDRPFIKPDGQFDRRANTGIMSDQLLALGAQPLNHFEELMPGHFRYSSDVLGRQSPETYAVHHFAAHWVRQPVGPRAEVFDTIYRNSAWGKGSGPGSAPENTADYRAFLATYMQEHAVASVLDIGCGDWQSSKLIDWTGIAYTGIDVSACVIEANARAYPQANLQFTQADAVSDELPMADLVILKDCLQHLSNESCSAVLHKLRDHPRVLIVHDTETPKNVDIPDGKYRRLAMHLAPFNLPVKRLTGFSRCKGKHVWEWLPGQASELWSRLTDVSHQINTVRYGPLMDGGYVVPDISYDQVITVGVGGCVAFERHLQAAQPNCKFVLYDHTVGAPSLMPPSWEFRKQGMGTHPGMLTLPEIIALCKVGTTLLKIDCEGAEWAADMANADLSAISVVVIELHYLRDVSRYPEYLRQLKPIFDQFVLVNFHPNNYPNADPHSMGGSFVLDGELYPDVVELTFVRRDLYTRLRVENPVRGRNFPCSPRHTHPFPDLQIQAAAPCSPTDALEPCPTVLDTSHGGDEIRRIELAIENAEKLRSALPPQVMGIKGMSSPKCRHFLNNLLSGQPASCHYLEIGCWGGSTFVSALYGNHVEHTAIDNFTQFGGPREAFHRNCAMLGRPVRFWECDALNVDASRHIHGVTVYFYDGGHTRQDHMDALTRYVGSMADTFIYIVDDWNWEDVRAGTCDGIAAAGLEVLYKRELPARFNGDLEQWWNGLAVFVLRKPGAV